MALPLSRRCCDDVPRRGLLYVDSDSPPSGILAVKLRLLYSSTIKTTDPGRKLPTIHSVVPQARNHTSKTNRLQMLCSATRVWHRMIKFRDYAEIYAGRCQLGELKGVGMDAILFENMFS
ncbi:hypothetical protein K0M31_016942 [Melipona bicolor]|uniref:Uncharacterized protein n=1 Tax=Melipona bicolor TaxID=60889 RepID=A0AA40KEH3_9HYME|nr:hypothetical protein K0M31_016942 [Melipona bicolor]